MDVELPDGRVLKGVPDGTTKAQLAEKLKGNGFDVPKEWTQPKSPREQLDAIQPSVKSDYKEPGYLDRIVGQYETGASMLSGMAGSVVGNLAGVGKSLMGGSPQEAEGVKDRVSQAMTFQPRTQSGQEQNEQLGAALSLMPPIMGDVPNVSGLARRAQGAMRDQPTSVKPAAPTSAPLGDGPNLGAVEAPKAAASAQSSPKVAYARAEQAVRSKTGIDWSGLPRAVRERITELAKDATTFDQMTPDMLTRAARLDSLPNPIKGTKGQLSRDPVQLRTESQLAQTDAGTPIRETHVEQNRQLLANLDTLKGKTGAKALTEEGVGKSVDVALGTKANKAINNYERLYKEADEAGETNGKVSVYPLLDHLAEHADPTQIPYVRTKLEGMGLLTKDDFGNPMPTGDITLKQLESVRKAAGVAMKAGGEKAHYAGELVNVIDKMTEGKGGEKYQQARAAFKAYKLEFDEQKAVKDLVGMRNRMDRTTSLENVFSKTIIGGDLQSLRQVKRSLLTGGDKETTALGVQAWKDLRGQAVQFIKDEATKGVAPDEAGNPNVTAQGMKRALDRIGDDRLNELFGKNAANQMRNLLEATRDLKTQPPARIAGSDTHVNLLNSLDKIVGHLPVAGPLARGAVKLGKKAYEMGTEEKRAGEALKPTLKDYQEK